MLLFGHLAFFAFGLPLSCDVTKRLAMFLCFLVSINLGGPKRDLRFSCCLSDIVKLWDIAPSSAQSSSCRCLSHQTLFSSLLFQGMTAHLEDLIPSLNPLSVLCFPTPFISFWTPFLWVLYLFEFLFRDGQGSGPCTVDQVFPQMRRPPCRSRTFFSFLLCGFTRHRRCFYFLLGSEMSFRSCPSRFLVMF